MPERFRRARLLIVGCGDVGLRLVHQLARTPGGLSRRIRVLGTSRRDEQAAAIRAAGAVPLALDLDRKSSLQRLAGLGMRTVMLAPPPPSGASDPRTAGLLRALRARRHGLRPAQPRRSRSAPPPARRSRARSGAAGRKGRAARFVYVSTTGVYGDCGGASFDETRPPAPANARAVRRLHAERSVRSAGRTGVIGTSILRAPGIYAHDRLPVDRLRAGTPALAAADDVFTNHVHADDLAALCWLALHRAPTNRVFHAVDDSDLRMGDYFDLVADRLGLPRPPRLARAEIAQRVSPAMLSFMSESRRLRNRRLHQELRLRLRYPTVAATLASLATPLVA